MFNALVNMVRQWQAVPEPWAVTAANVAAVTLAAAFMIIFFVVSVAQDVARAIRERRETYKAIAAARDAQATRATGAAL